MIRIDEELLAELGLAALPAADKSSLLKFLYETLEMRAGLALIDLMTDDQLDEFEARDGDDAEQFACLERTVPEYGKIVSDLFDALKAEVAADAPRILRQLGVAP